ncbi:fork head domain-containing protein [Mycena maculata]|uniref:Fork head domain-containing protein n=1 Tax=Mycena maculata TaxID=230809 RepID=A0AAD7NHW4_9AGAR|nr:fork head domain-containing protein [Mycena maculata]
MALPPSVFHRDLIHVETGERLRRLFNLPLGAPVNLSAVLDRADGSRPEVSLPLLAQLAIYGSENQMLTLQGIFQALKDRFRYYRETTEKAWQNSIRHVLSLRTVFVRVERQAHHAGKGAYWTLGTSSGDQYKRPRKRVTATGGDERKTPPAAPDRVSSPKVAANVCWPIPASPSPELRQTSPYLTPHKHDGHSESAQANIDPALPDRPLSFISFPPTAPSSRSDVNYVAGTREQSIEADPADRAGIRASRRLLSRSDSLPSSDPASTSPITSAKKGRRSRA